MTVDKNAVEKMIAHWELVAARKFQASADEQDELGKHMLAAAGFSMANCAMEARRLFGLEK